LRRLARLLHGGRRKIYWVFIIFVLMFVTIVHILYILVIAAEIYLFRAVTRFWSRRTKLIYYIFGAIALCLYPVLFLLGKEFDLDSVGWSFASSFAGILFILDVIWKIIMAAGVALRRVSHRKWWTAASWVMTGIFTALVLYGLFWERNMLRVKRVDLTVAGLPDEADGLRIVQTGDIHIGRKLNRYRMLRRLVDAVNGLDGDIVIDCGDLTDAKYNEVDATAVDILSGMSARKGIYTVLGNHDKGIYINDTIKLPREENTRRLIELERQIGWRTLVDSTAYIRFGSDSIAITGLDYPNYIKPGSHGVKISTDYSAVYDKLPEGIFNITVAHTPSAWDNILGYGKSSLTLSGHVHAMHCKIPIGPRGWSPAALVYKEWSGLYERDGRFLNITDGVGSTMPLRVGAPPEITLIVLHKKR